MDMFLPLSWRGRGTMRKRGRERERGTERERESDITLTLHKPLNFTTFPVVQDRHYNYSGYI